MHTCLHLPRYTPFGHICISIYTSLCISLYYLFILADINDNIDVSLYLTCLKKEELKILGQILGLSYTTVTNHIDSSLVVYRSSIVEAWLLKQDKVAEKGDPSWSTLEAALKHELLGQNGIADKIHRELNTCVFCLIVLAMWSIPLS